MYKLLTFIIVLIMSMLCFGQSSKLLEKGLTRISTGIIIDTLHNEVELLINSNGQPKKYVSSVFTPVCHTADNECLPVNIEVYWDLSGNYLQFAFQDGDSLTKVDHIPFTPNDYLYLNRILKNDKSKLKNYTSQQLSPKKRISDVDGVSGSTIPELEGYYVPGALYTSHTLWHLINGPTKELLIQYTENTLMKNFPSGYFLTHKELGLQKTVLHQLASSSGSYSHFINSMIDTTDNDITVSCLALIGRQNVLNDTYLTVVTQKYLITKSDEVHAQIIDLWMDQQLPESVQLALVQLMGKHSATFDNEFNLMASQLIWYESVYYAFVDRIISTRNMIRKEKIKKLLDTRAHGFSRKFRKFYDKSL